MSERLANFIILLEEHFENDEISFQNVYESMKLIKGNEECSFHIVFVTFLWVPLHEERKYDVIVLVKLLNST